MYAFSCTTFPPPTPSPPLKIRFWDIRDVTSEPLFEVKLDKGAGVPSLTFNPDLSLLYVACKGEVRDDGSRCDLSMR